MGNRPPYYEKLEKIRDALENTVTGFPKDGCASASYVAAKLIPELEQTGGEYIMRNPVQDDRVLLGDDNPSHSWLVDKQRGYNIDLTQDQFGEGAPKIKISKIESDEFLKEVGYLKDTLNSIEYPANLVSNVENYIKSN